MKGHSCYTLSPWPSVLWRIYLRFYKEVTEVWYLEEAWRLRWSSPCSIIPHSPIWFLQNGKKWKLEIRLPPQGMGVGLKCLSWEAPSLLCGDITITEMCHFCYHSVSLMHGSSFTFQLVRLSSWHSESSGVTSSQPSAMSLCKWSHNSLISFSKV